MDSFKIKISEQWFSVTIVKVRESFVDVIVDGEPVLIDTRILSGESPQLDESNTNSLPSQIPAEAKPIVAPMPGMVISVQTQLGASVKTGDILCTLEAMKMEHEISTPNEGTVKSIFVHTGDNVTIGQNLF
ncbi:hypothetical protein FIM04_02185, partial [SAR202 cluster bacterium AC-409-J13_OGT_754m]|nr:hypothetical protein [SAR202 cluster bacterium AC-409-J13_OGT_754m]